MTPLFDINDHPDRFLQVRKIVGIDQHLSFANATEMIKRDIAMMLANRILESKDFIKIQGNDIFNVRHVEYSVECVVLTIDELLSFKKDAFTKGVLHAQNFQMG